jgi:muramoyltetrapeptide carboxypeptidase LdcA involved in peptidoglycan recycling
MTEFAFQQQMPEMTVKYLQQALFEEGEIEVDISSEFNDIGLDWSAKDNLDKQRSFEQNDGLQWDGAKNATGILWGGYVESLIVQCSTEKYLPNANDLEETILFIETAEDLPEAWIVDYLLTGLGERGWFDKFQAVLVGRPKAWEFNKQNTTEQKAEYKRQQRETVLNTIREYSKTIPVIQNLDFGHTAPQIAMPYGGTARIDSTAQKVFLSY